MSENIGYRAYDEGVRQLTVEEWVAILQDEEVTHENNIQILNAFFSSVKNYASYGKEIARKLGYAGDNVNGQIKGHAIRIAKKYNVEFSLHRDGKTRYWAFFFYGQNKESSPFWQKLKPNLVEAMKRVSLPDDTSESIVYNPTAPEGKRIQCYVTKYERSPVNRSAAIQWHIKQYGELCCCVCGFSFEKTYGGHGIGFIEVHHKKPLHSRDEEVVIDPKTDLECLCSNCHRMIHHERGAIFTSDELRAIIEEKK